VAGKQPDFASFHRALSYSRAEPTIGSTAITALPVVTNQGFQNLVAKNGTHGLWLFYCISSETTNFETKGFREHVS
jgi:hypothetical protein